MFRQPNYYRFHAQPMYAMNLRKLIILAFIVQKTILPTNNSGFMMPTSSQRNSYNRCRSDLVYHTNSSLTSFLGTLGVVFLNLEGWNRQAILLMFCNLYHYNNNNNHPETPIDSDFRHLEKRASAKIHAVLSFSHLHRNQRFPRNLFSAILMSYFVMFEITHHRSYS